jgi:uncharacterized protein (DUF58 family)
MKFDSLERRASDRFEAPRNTRWHGLDRPSWRSFFIALVALAAALFLALYSGTAAQTGHLVVAIASALTALALAGWVALTIVPVLARRTPLRWLTYQIDYKLTREGIVYLVGIVVVAVSAVNTGNNLLFMILSCLLAGVLISGFFSRLVLSGIDVRLELPEHIFAERAVLAIAELQNTKQLMPSFSVSLISEEKQKTKKDKDGAANPIPRILKEPIYFPHIPRRQAVRQNVDLTFPRRGVYRQDALGLRTRFPFGFLQKTRRVDSEIEALVYPAVQPTEEFYEILPLVSGELESYQRGRGHDLYAIRDYQFNDSARHVDWKASARTGALQVREFAREDERRVMLAFDPYLDPSSGNERTAVQFERAVALCAGLAWHFYEINSVIEFRSAGFATPRAPAGEIVYDILRYLASVTTLKPPPGKSFLDALEDAPDIFKIVLTSHPRGSIPTGLWNSSYFLFVSSL